MARFQTGFNANSRDAGEGSTTNLAAVPQPVDGVVVATHPNDALDVVRQCARRSVKRVWLHRSFGQGSVSEAAVREGATLGIECK